MAKCVKSIQERLKKYLKTSGVTKGDFARLAGISQPYLSQLLAAANSSPGVEQLEGLASAMSISLAELVTDPKEWLALKQHSVTDCLDVVRRGLEVLERGSEDEAFDFFRPPKR